VIGVRDRRADGASQAQFMRRYRTRPSLAIAAAIAVAAGLAGCGSSYSSTNAPAGTRTPAPPAASGQQVAIAADPGGALKFTRDTLSAKAGNVTFDFTNASGTGHGFEVQGNGVDKATDVIADADAKLPVTLKPGTYTYFCPVPGHREAGMQGTLTVR
jgi:plastocyanin